MMTVFDKISFLVSIVISLVTFIIGACKLFKKGIPVYFKIMVCASGCYALQEICAVVYAACGNIYYSGFQVSVLGTAGCFLFMLTALYGVFDKELPRGNKKEKAIALIAPILAVVFCAYFIITYRNSEYFSTAIYTAILSMPFLFTSYYALKHLLIPSDKCENLAAVKPCCAFILLFVVLNFLFYIAYFFGTAIMIELVSIVLSLCVLCIVLASIKGAKRWKA